MHQMRAAVRSRSGGLSSERISSGTLGEVLKREGQLLEVVEEVLAEVRRIREASEYANPEKEAAQFEEQYLRGIIKKLDYMELFGVDVSPASRRHRLSVAYISLCVRQKRSDEEPDRSELRYEDGLGAEEESDGDYTIKPVEKVLKYAGRLVVRGEAGSGKTTLLRWIAVNSARRSFEDGLAEWNDAVPFFIPLRRCVGSRLPAPEEFPRLILPSIAEEMPDLWVHQTLRSGRAIVLIDGVDEVPSSQRSAVREWLDELSSTFGGARFIISSRPSAIQDGWMSEEGFEDAELQPMELPDIWEFIDHWHADVDGAPGGSRASGGGSKE